MNYKIYVIGDKFEDFYTDAIKEYEKRLSRYCKIQLIHTKKPQDFLSILPQNTFKISISNRSTSISSEALALKIDTLGLTGVSNVSIILGYENLDYDDSITVSSMDMDLGLMATILYEQIYRAYRILNNQAYHK
ncbi:MAG: rRNA methyltransferase [Clostridiales bacterium]|nr:rRNA methyltransferase [Clostridiales bacterium]